MDNKGNFTLEIPIILIIFVLIFGVVLALNEISTQKIIKDMINEHDETLIEGVVDNLITSPGNPNNWENYEKGTPGLAIFTSDGEIIPNSVSYQKFMKLKSNYEKYVTQKLFDSKIKTSMELIPHDSTISSVKIGNKEYSNNIYSVTRLVKCDFYKKYVIKDFKNNEKCNHNHDSSKNSCNYFKVFRGNLKNYNYYLLFDKSEINKVKYFFDTTKDKKSNWKTVMSDKIYLNDDINFLDDSSAIVFIHINKPKSNALLVAIPKNLDEYEFSYDYFRTNDCEFILKAWY